MVKYSFQCTCYHSRNRHFSDALSPQDRASQDTGPHARIKNRFIINYKFLKNLTHEGDRLLLLKNICAPSRCRERHFGIKDPLGVRRSGNTRNYVGSGGRTYHVRRREVVVDSLELLLRVQSQSPGLRGVLSHTDNMQEDSRMLQKLL